MKYAVDNVIHSCLRKKTDEYDVLYMPYGGYYDYMFQQTGFNLYCLENTVAYNTGLDINNLFKATWLKSYKGIPNRINLDAIIVNSKKQLIFAKELSNLFHVNIIEIDHEDDPKYGFNIPKDISFKTNDVCKIEGRPKYVESIIQEMLMSRIFSSYVDDPFYPLLAASLGCVVIGQKNGFVGKYFDKGSAIFVKDLKGLKIEAKKLLRDKDRLANIALKGQKLIAKNFNATPFIDYWKNKLGEVSKKVFVK